jgi:hypothetical protein
MAAALRLYDLGGQSIWLDELFSLETSAGRNHHHLDTPLNEFLVDPPITTSLADARPWYYVLGTPSLDIHPPLYFLLLRGWRELWGDSDTWARGLSVIWSVATVLLVYAVGRMLSGQFTAAWATLLCALATPQIQYAQEIRHYAMLSALVLACAAVLLWIERRGRSPWRMAWLALLVLAALLTHYFALPALAAIGLHALIRLRGRDRWAAVGAMGAGVILFALLWGPSIVEQSRAGAVSIAIETLLEPPDGHWLKVLDRLALLPARFISEPPPADRFVVRGMAIILLLPYLLLILPAVAVAANDWLRSTALLNWIRFTLVAAPGLYLMLPMLIDRPRLRWILPAACSAMALLGIGDAYRTYTENYREVAEYFDTRARPGDLILSSSINAQATESHPGVLHMGVRHYLRRSDLTFLLIDDIPSDQLRQAMRRYPRVLMLWGFPQQRFSEIFPDATPGDGLISFPLGRAVTVQWDAAADGPATGVSPKIE